MDLTLLLAPIPNGLKIPLIQEYNSLMQNYLERRWTWAELSWWRFSEIVFTILDGYSKWWVYAAKPFKPNNMVDACRALEKAPNLPRSFQILIPRLLPALYEIRNNRSVWHVWGEVDSNAMDSNFVVTTCSWIMGELIRVYHNINIEEAEKVINFITSRKIPLVWDIGNIKKVLDPNMSVKNQICILLIGCTEKISLQEIFKWTESKDKKYFLKTLRALHKAKMIHYDESDQTVIILPPWVIYSETLLSKRV